MTFSGDRTQTDFSLEERPMKQEIIRKLSAAVAMSLVVGVSLAACGGSSSTAAGVTKTGSAEGFGGAVTATLTVDANGTVTDCKLEGAQETESIGGAALEELSKQVVAANGPAIDGVAGATVTTKAVRKAVAAALGVELAEEAPADSAAAAPAEPDGKQIRNLQEIHHQELEAKDKEISRLNAILEKAFNWFPLLKEMLRMEKLCYAIGFTKDMVNSLLTKKEAIRCNGKVYSEEHRRRFEIKNDVFKVEKSSVDDNKLVLTINRQPISEWFKEQWEKLRQGLRQSTEESRKSRGFRM